MRSRPLLFSLRSFLPWKVNLYPSRYRARSGQVRSGHVRPFNFHCEMLLDNEFIGMEFQSQAHSHPHFHSLSTLGCVQVYMDVMYIHQWSRPLPFKIHPKISFLPSSALSRCRYDVYVLRSSCQAMTEIVTEERFSFTIQIADKHPPLGIAV